MTTTGNVRARRVTEPVSTPVLIKLEKVTVMENDPAQNVRADAASGQVRISGTANNRGIVASFLKLDVGGKSINVDLRGGMDPGRTAQAIEAKLPGGYSIHYFENPHRAGADVVFGIVKGGSTGGTSGTGGTGGTGGSTGGTTGTRKKPSVSVMENDPAQSMKADKNVITISGTATNNGFAASFAQVTVDKKKINIPLSRGMDPQDTANALQNALPDGYKATIKVLRAPGAPVDDH